MGEYVVEWVDLVSVRVVQYFLVCLLLICRACRRDIIDCTANLSSRPDIVDREKSCNLGLWQRQNLIPSGHVILVSTTKNKPPSDTMDTSVSKHHTDGNAEMEGEDKPREALLNEAKQNFMKLRKAFTSDKIASVLKHLLQSLHLPLDLLNNG